MKEHYQKIIKELEFFRYQKDIIEVFKDLLCVMAMRTAIHFESENKQKQRQKTIKDTLGKYDAKGKAQMDVLHNLVVEMLKESANDFGDHLGNIYMSIVPKARAKNFGQFFTPYHLSVFMAETNLGNCQEEVKAKGVIKINDPCVGAGGMLVAAVEVLHKQGINYLQYAEFWGNDIDLTCCYMAYLQLAFLGTAAVIEHKNTITQETWDVFVTPGFYLRDLRIVTEEEQKLLTALRTVDACFKFGECELNRKKA